MPMQLALTSPVWEEVIVALNYVKNQNVTAFLGNGSKFRTFLLFYRPRYPTKKELRIPKGVFAGYLEKDALSIIR